MLALGFAGGLRVASAAPPSPLAKAVVNQINALASAHENWAKAVCPVFAKAVAYYDDFDPKLAQYFADYYSDVVCTVADNYLAFVNTTANVYLPLLNGNSDKDVVNAARSAALARIRTNKGRCVAVIQAEVSVPEPT